MKNSKYIEWAEKLITCDLEDHELEACHEASKFFKEDAKKTVADKKEPLV